MEKKFNPIFLTKDQVQELIKILEDQKELTEALTDILYQLKDI